METLYNLDKTPSAEPSLKRNIVPDAKRSENFTSLPWRAQSDSLWGHRPYSSVLQKTEIKMVFAKTGLFPPAFKLLSSRRVNPGHSLCFDCWHPPYPPSVRSRFFLSHPLWQVHRGSRSRLQSSQKRSPFLPSVALFRISFQRLLAWSLKTWKRLYLFGCTRILQRMSPKSSSWYLPDSSTSRFRFFRSQIYRASGPRGHWLC